MLKNNKFRNIHKRSVKTSTWGLGFSVVSYGLIIYRMGIPALITFVIKIMPLKLNVFQVYYLVN